MESRKKLSTTNIVFSTISFAVKYFLSFLLRNFVVVYLGVQYLGLNSLFTNILAILSLVEAGFGSALTYAMYKPMADNDYEKVHNILQFYKKIYIIVAVCIAVIGLAIMPFLNFLIINDSGIDLNIYLAFFVFLCNSVIWYLFAHRRSLFVASQRTDIETKIAMIVNILLSIAQIIVLILLKNYYVYIVTIPIFTLVEALLVGYITQKKYGHIISYKSDAQLSQSEKHEIRKNIYGMFFHKMGGTVLTCTDTIIISTCIGLTILGIYSNYLILVTAIASIVTIFTNAIRGSIGNLISTETKEYVYNVYIQLELCFNILVSFCCVSFVVLIQDFTTIWLGADYLLDFNVVIALTFMIYVNNIRALNYCFKECCGIFWQNRHAPIIEVIINLVLSLILVHYIGLLGVVLGTIISGILVPLWVDKWMVFKYYFQNKKLKNTFGLLVYNFIITLLVSVITILIVNNIGTGTIYLFIAKLIVSSLLAICLLLLSYIGFPSFRVAIKKVFVSVKNIFRKNH